MSWDGQKFWQTLRFFGTVPIVGDWEVTRSMLKAVGLGSPTAPQPGGPTVAVIGATGEIGRRLVRRWLAAGRSVLALGGQPDRLPVDPALRWIDLASLDKIAPSLFTGVETIAWCPEPGVTGWGIERWIDAAAAARAGDRLLFDFAGLAGPGSAASLAETWGAVDDGVMGGVSESGLRPGAGAARFGGVVSIANSGGFASVRTRPFAQALDLGETTAIALEVRGDGNRYKFFVRCDDRWDGLAYSQSFDTQALAPSDGAASGATETVRLPWSQFVPVVRARRVADAPPLDATRVRALQVMLSKFEYDGGLNPRFRPGPFALDLVRIWATSSRDDRPRFLLCGGSPEVVDYLRSTGLDHKVVAVPEALDAAIAERVAQELAAD